MTRFFGTGCSDGFAVAKVLKKEPIPASQKRETTDDPSGEVAKLNSAIAQLLKKLRNAYQDTLKKSVEEAELYEAYIVILEDHYFFDNVRIQITEKHLSAKEAVETVSAEAQGVFLSLEDTYMRERFADVKGVCDDIVAILEGLSDSLAQAVLTEPVVIVAESLTPLSTVHLDKHFLAGLVTKEGGITSHTAILARTLGIPAIIGVGNTLDAAKSGELIAISGYSGEVVLNPDSVTLEEFAKLQQKERQRRSLYSAEPAGEAYTIDGRRILVAANTGDPDSSGLLDPARCDGIGLLRTEFLYMQYNTYPDEETQYQAYRDVVNQMKGKEVTIRTLDIGGDKQLDYFRIPHEDNPFLGYRAIRICINRPEIFKTQLRAILRASAFGKVRVMFPMIVAMEEFVAAKQFFEDCKEELRKKGIAFDDNLPVGMMVETPAAALMADSFAAQADFFSIGTNDLIQYITATDRINQSVSYLYNNLNLAVLRAIRMVGKAAQTAGIPLSVCGETASVNEMIPFLIGCGVEELSVPFPVIDQLRYMVRRVSYGAAQNLVARVCECTDVTLAKQMLQKSAAALLPNSIL